MYNMVKGITLQKSILPLSRACHRLVEKISYFQGHNFKGCRLDNNLCPVFPSQIIDYFKITSGFFNKHHRFPGTDTRLCQRMDDPRVIFMFTVTCEYLPQSLSDVVRHLLRYPAGRRGIPQRRGGGIRQKGRKRYEYSRPLTFFIKCVILESIIVKRSEWGEVMTVIAIPKILQDKLTPEGAQALVEIINKSEEHSKENIIGFVEERFEKRLAQIKSDLVMWMFVFWVGQIGVLTGILFAFFKK